MYGSTNNGLIRGAGGRDPRIFNSSSKLVHVVCGKMVWYSRPTGCLVMALTQLLLESGNEAWCRLNMEIGLAVYIYMYFYVLLVITEYCNARFVFFFFV